MPRVLILGEFPTLNGGERSLLAVLPMLQSAGWQVDAHVPAAGLFAEKLRSLQISIHGTPPTGTPLEVRRSALAEILKASKYDLVHANSLAMGRMAGPVSAAANLPSLAHLRDIIGLNAQSIADLNQNSRLLAVSQAVADFHAHQGLARDQLHVLHNGIDLAVFAPSSRVVAGQRVSIRTELGLSPEAQLIAVIGQIIIRKGQDVALSAAVQVLRGRPHVHVLVLGTRHSTKPETVEFERRLHRIVDGGGAADRVHFLGTRDDLATLMPQFDVLLHTARQEPLGRVLLEAAACGVPVIATDVGGTREIFPREQGDGATLVPSGDPIAAAEAMSLLLDNADLRRRIGVAGRRRIETAFSAEKSAAGLLEQYQLALGRSSDRIEPA